MKILVIDSPFLPTHIGGDNFGGIETFVDAFCLNNVDFGHDVTLITTQDSTADLLEFEPNFHMYKTESNSKIKLAVEKNNPKARFNYGEINKLIVSLGVNNFDLVICNSDKIAVNNILYREAEKYDTHNIVNYLHNLPIFMGSDKTATKFLSFKSRITFVANSRFTYNKWNNFVKKITENDEQWLIKGIVDLNINDMSLRDDKEIDHLWSIHEQGLLPKNFAFIGRITEQKQPTLAKRLSLEMPEHRFNFFGIKHYEDKESKKFDELQAGSNFFFYESLPIKVKLGTIKNEGLVTLSTSTWETYGITAVESFAMGLPVIVLNNNDNNIVNFLRDPIIKHLEDASYPMSVIGDDPRSKEIKYGFTVCELGAIISRGNPKVMAQRIENALDLLNDIYKPDFIINYFRENFAFSPEFVEDLYKLTINE